MAGADGPTERVEKAEVVYDEVARPALGEPELPDGLTVGDPPRGGARD